MHETLRRSTLGELRGGRAGQPRARACAPPTGSAGTSCRATSTASATVAAVREDGFARVVTIAPDDPALLRYVVHKGSISVDGVSLTVARDRRRGLRRLAHPRDARAHDARRARPPGARVNLEVDVVAKYVEKLLAR